ncbi:MAG: hypothetical protein ACOZNI_16045 [Myxococcota bacterium]
MLPLLIACEGGDSSDGEEAPAVHVTALEVSPAEASLVTGPGGGEPLQYEVVATFEDGKTGKLETAEWSVSNRSSGTIDEAGLFTPSTENGGVTYVTAAFDGVEAQALLTVVYEDELVDGDVDTRGFEGTEVPTDLWLYPEHDVNFPRNTPSIEFQWQDVGAQAYRLRFHADVTELTVYTASTSWTADETTWANIVATNAGGSVEVELSAVVGREVWADEPITLNVNRMDGVGSIYYWCTSTSGVMSIPYGGTASEYLTATTTGHCVGCHDISSTGLIAFTYDGGDQPMGVKRMSDGSDVVGFGVKYANFHTFSPDGVYLLSSFQGALILSDAESGATLWEVAVDGWATQPDWSPDGDRVVYVNAGSPSADWVFTGGVIYVMDHVGGGQFGTPRAIYTPPAGYNAYYPTFSPDGEWIAFDLSTEDAYDDASALVYVMDAEGGTPVELTAANQTAGLSNSWPRWAPLPDDDVLWLAFSSKRAYGRYTSGWPQIWVAAFDPERAGRGVDPSWPAFWLPGQDAAQSNHIPVWTE